MTTDTTNENKAGWDQAAAASAAAETAKREEPRRREFVDKLRVPLTDKELIKLQDEISDCESELEAFVEDFETKKANHKASVKKKKAKIAELSQQRRDKHRLRSVKCVEYTDFGLNERWRVRLDTNEKYASEALEPGERQQLLYPDDPEDGQLGLPGDDGSEDDDDAETEDDSDGSFADDGADDDSDPPPGTLIDKPEEVLGKKGSKVKR